MSKQPYLASAERLFGNFYQYEGRQRQSTSISTLEITEMLRVCVKMRLEDTLKPQNGLLHPLASAIRRTVEHVALEVNRNR